MPFDGNPLDYAPQLPKGWAYVTVPIGRDRWRVDVLFEGVWQPMFSFRAIAYRHARAVSAWAVSTMQAQSRAV